MAGGARPPLSTQPGRRVARRAIQEPDIQHRRTPTVLRPRRSLRRRNSFLESGPNHQCPPAVMGGVRTSLKGRDREAREYVIRPACTPRHHDERGLVPKSGVSRPGFNSPVMRASRKCRSGGFHFDLYEPRESGLSIDVTRFDQMLHFRHQLVDGRLPGREADQLLVAGFQAARIHR